MKLTINGRQIDYEGDGSTITSISEFLDWCVLQYPTGEGITTSDFEVHEHPVNVIQ